MSSSAGWSPVQTVPPSGHSLSGTRPYVVVIFGRTGVGVSSLINLIIGHPASNDHPDAKTRAPKHKPTPYSPVTFPRSEQQFCLYEIPGFCGNCSDASIVEAIREIDQKEGVDLFIYCLRKQRATVMPPVVRYIRESVAQPDVPMIAVVTELELFEGEHGMEDWWDAPLESGLANGLSIEDMCFVRFDAHACVTTLPRREVDLVDKLRKRRDISEERVRRLIVEQCTGPKRPASDSPGSPWPCRCLSTLFVLAALRL